MQRTRGHVILHALLQHGEVVRQGQCCVVLGIRHLAVAVLMSEVQHAVHQIAQNICQLRVVHGDQRVLGKVQVRTVGGGGAEIVADRVHVVLGQNIERINRVVVRFAHFSAIRSVHETVREDLAWQGDASTHQHARPDNAVEPDNVLADNVGTGGPVLVQWMLRGCIRGTPTHLQGIHTGEIVGQSVEPHIHHVLAVEVLRHGNAPIETGTRDRQILEALLGQATDDVVAELLWLNASRILCNVRQQTLTEVTHLEEITLLLDNLQRKTTAGIFEVGSFSVRLGHKNFLAFVVPTLISTQIDVSAFRTHVPQLLRSANVAIIGCTDKVRVRN
mmetsp:Transcript_40765/g.70591  ORF Transcript_40765/g.70591 Transcript_40765/m.70591 type:complete len:332 (-) Transcript_40765:373-1368(-)